MSDVGKLATATWIAGGECACVGDVVATRRNHRRLTTTAGEPVRTRTLSPRASHPPTTASVEPLFHRCVWEITMVDRREQLLGLLKNERDPLACLVIADELAQELRVPSAVSPTRRTVRATHGLPSARRSA